jgi:hypothetical protein
VRLDQPVANSRKTRPDQGEAFYNRDLGEPYAPAEHRLSIDQIRACVHDDLRLLPELRYPERPVCMGVDVASTRALNVVIEEILDGRSGRRIFVCEVEDGPDGTGVRAALRAHGALRGVARLHRPGAGAQVLGGVRGDPGRVALVGYYTPSPVRAGTSARTSSTRKHA